MVKRIVELCRRYSSERLSQASFEQLQCGVARTSSGALWGLMAADLPLPLIVFNGVRRKLLQGFGQRLHSLHQSVSFRLVERPYFLFP